MSWDQIFASYLKRLKQKSWLDVLKPSHSVMVRRRKNSIRSSGPAELLELRAMLTSSVSAVIGQNHALTLTVTENSNDVSAFDVYRLDATHVEIDGFGGTAINGQQPINGFSSIELVLPTVSGITVNLGKGQDIVKIESSAIEGVSYPPLDVGTGGIAFQGAGGEGDEIDIANNGSNLMEIRGDVSIHGMNPNSPYLVTGVPHAPGFSFSIDQPYDGGGIQIGGNVNLSETANSGNVVSNVIGSQFGDHGGIGSGGSSIAIEGNVLESITASGNSDAENLIEDDSPAGIVIDGYATMSVTAGTGQIASNTIWTTDTGAISIGGGVAQSMNAGSTTCSNSITTEDQVTGGNIGVVLGVSQSCTSAGNGSNSIQAVNGNLTIGGTIAQAVSGLNSQKGSNTVEVTGVGNLTSKSVSQGAVGNVSASNTINDNGIGNLTVNGSVTQSLLGMELSNNIDDSSSGNLSITSAVTQQVLAGQGDLVNAIADNATGNLTIGANGITISTQIVQTGGQGSIAKNSVTTKTAGKLTTKGPLKITTDNNSAVTASTTDLIATSGGTQATLSLSGISIFDQGPMKQINTLKADGAALSVGNSGVSVSSTGNGTNTTQIITAAASSPISVTGPVVVNEPGNGNSTFNIGTDSKNSPITIIGTVSYDNHQNQLGASNISMYGATDVTNSKLAILGGLNLTMADSHGQAHSDGSYSANLCLIGGGSSNLTTTGTTIQGTTTITGGDGPDSVGIFATSFQAPVTIDLKSSPNASSSVVSHNDLLSIGSSLFFNSVTITMTGPNTQLNLDSPSANFGDFFGGLFKAKTMGSKPIINMAATTNSPGAKVTFGTGGYFFGTPGTAGAGVVTYHAANVIGPFYVFGLAVKTV